MKSKKHSCKHRRRRSIRKKGGSPEWRHSLLMWHKLASKYNMINPHTTLDELWNLLYELQNLHDNVQLLPNHYVLNDNIAYSKELFNREINYAMMKVKNDIISR